MPRSQFKRMTHNQASTKAEAYQKHRTCDRKKVYPSYGEGWKAVRHIQRNGNDPFPEFELRPYLCAYCKKIHVGHANMPKSSEARVTARVLQQVGHGRPTTASITSSRPTAPSSPVFVAPEPHSYHGGTS